MNSGIQHWLKFNAVGILGAAVQLAVLTALVAGMAVDYLPATFVAVEAAVLHNFVWHERWTWANRAKRGGVPLRLVHFNLANGLISIAGNLVLMRFLIGTFHVHYLPANLIAIAACSLTNFFVSDRLVYRVE